MSVGARVTVDMAKGEISLSQVALDLAMTALGVLGGPVGATFSIIYFGSKATYELSTGETIDIER